MLRLSCSGCFSVLLCLGLLFTLGCSASKQVSHDASLISGEIFPEKKPMMMTGPDLFATHCASCHPLSHLNPQGPIYQFLTQSEASFEHFVYLLRHGSDNSGYMRQFSEAMLSNSEAQVLYQWLDERIENAS